MTATQITPQTAMTLATIAPTGATPRPSGETLRDQTERVRTGVAWQLSQHTSWALNWLVLTPDNANMAYIAVNTEPGSNQLAVVIRGTVDNPADSMEDFDVSTVVPFTAGIPAGQAPISVSKGAMAAFTQIVNANPDVLDPLMRQDLARRVLNVTAKMEPNPTLFVIGHSLGGCVATMIALYLRALTYANLPNFGILTFAAPTAGLDDFAKYFDRQTWAQCERHVNHYDLIPQAWDKLNIPVDPLKPWYPAPGPKMTGAMDALINTLKAKPGNNKYVQPMPIKEWNAKYETVDKNLVRHTNQDFMGQVGYQHANATYLSLLGADVTLDAAPTVTEVDPSFGTQGSQVTITGTGFALFPKESTFVDFGPIAYNPGSIEIKSDTQIVLNNVPYGYGIVTVQVTNPLGTSAASPIAQYAYGGPAPVAVTGVEVSDTITTVTISGTGFAEGAVVYFGTVESQDVTLKPDPPRSPKLVATIPPPAKAGETVDITVVLNGYSSPTSPADEFTYPG
jgi:hypothetical protein